nr:hypothetical protein CFP56_09838 [Quercus suber]
MWLQADTRAAEQEKCSEKSGISTRDWVVRCLARDHPRDRRHCLIGECARHDDGETLALKKMIRDWELCKGEAPPCGGADAIDSLSQIYPSSSAIAWICRRGD